jgi:hypothetical protein
LSRLLNENEDVEKPMDVDGVVDEAGGPELMFKETTGTDDCVGVVIEVDTVAVGLFVEVVDACVAELELAPTPIPIGVPSANIVNAYRLYSYHK